ncbi:MAG: Stp1/IreP family PP2C-type Ser/Thr phosphatase, partial [Myxococcota bacterium]
MSTEHEEEETTPQPGYNPATATTATATDIGRVRTINQDDFGEFHDPATGRRLLLVADGMGGHRGGEVASRITVQRVREVFERSPDTDPEALLSEALAEANLSVFERASGDTELAGMGTTAVALLLTADKGACLAHVGDSRAYRLRDGRLRQLTSDHSVVGELVRRGQLSAEEARHHPQSNEILRALGTRPELNVELTPVDTRPGDRFLLCSDGLSGMLANERIEACLAEGSAPKVT